MNLTRDFHPSQVMLIFKIQQYTAYGRGACYSTVILLMLALPFTKNDFAKGAIYLSQIVTFTTGFKLENLKKLIADDHYDVSLSRSTQGLSSHLESSFAPPKRDIAIASTVPTLQILPLVTSDICKALSKPHILLLGETGSGKSTLVKFLVSHASAPSLVLDSHAAPDDWQGMNVIGMGRNYSAIGAEVVRLVELMNERYEARGKGQKQFEPFLIILDEFPACAANLGKSFTENIMLLVRESRKVSIKLIILSQGSEVKTLGIEGQGSIRECFAIVSLGKFAVDRAKSLKDEQIKTFIASAQYPAMLDDLPCELPKIDSVNLPTLPMPSDYLGANNASQTAIASTNSTQAIAPVMQKMINFLDGRDWTRDNYIKQSITEFKIANTSIEEIQGYLQFLEVKGHLQTRNVGRGDKGLEAKKI